MSNRNNVKRGGKTSPEEKRPVSHERRLMQLHYKRLINLIVPLVFDGLLTVSVLAVLLGVTWAIQLCSNVGLKPEYAEKFEHLHFWTIYSSLFVLSVASVFKLASVAFAKEDTED